MHWGWNEVTALRQGAMPLPITLALGLLAAPLAAEAQPADSGR